jgi:hypothetical protein
MYMTTSCKYWFVLWVALIFIAVYVSCKLYGCEYFGALALASAAAYAFLIFNVEFVQHVDNACNVVYVALSLLFFSICTSFIIQTATLRVSSRNKRKPLKKR